MEGGSNLKKTVKNLTYEELHKQKRQLTSTLLKIYPDLVNFEPDIQSIVETFTLSLDNRLNLETIIRKLNDHLSKSTFPSDGLIKFKKLIFSKNNLNNLDALPIGIILSIDMHSHAAQAALNVKHTKILYSRENLKSSENSEVITNQELKHPILPDIDVTVLHQGVKYCWFRIKLFSHQDFSQLELPFTPVHYYFYTSLIVEIYYHRECRNYKDIYWLTMDYLNSSPLIDKIYFFSDCRLVERIDNKVIQFSNTLKFLYCYRLNTASFSVTSIDDLENLFKLLIRTTVFLYRRNFNMVNEDLDTPFTALTGERAHINVRRFLSEENIYSVNNARDGLILGTGTQIGGINPHEVIIKCSDFVK
ncbi:viral RNA polymerase subunit p47 [Microplitis demolitor]|nr:viral RNA polymerase subunit p47 [Microplitis demolitor]